MNTLWDDEPDIPISAARLYPHVADDEAGTNLPVEPGLMGFNQMVVERNISPGHITINAAPEEPEHPDDPYCFELDLTPAAARELARQLNGAADAVEMLAGRRKAAMHEAVAIAPDLPAGAAS